MRKPLNGTSFQTLGDLPVEIDFTYHPGSPQTRDYPGDPDEVEITGIRYSYKGEFSGAIELDMISDSQQDRWTEKILEEMADALAEGPEDDDIRDYDYPEEP